METFPHIMWCQSIHWSSFAWAWFDNGLADFCMNLGIPQGPLSFIRVFVLRRTTLNITIYMLGSSPIILGTKQHVKRAKAHQLIHTTIFQMSWLFLDF